MQMPGPRLSTCLSPASPLQGFRFVSLSALHLWWTDSACGLERSHPKLPMWDRSEWANLNPDQCASWGPWFVALLKILLGLNTKHGIMACSAHHEDHIISLQARLDGRDGGRGCVHLQTWTRIPGSRGITWITIGKVLQEDAGCGRPGGAEMPEARWIVYLTLSVVITIWEYHCISFSSLPPSLPLLLSRVLALPRLHSLESDWRGSPPLLTGLIYLGYLWELGWKLPY